MNRKERTEQKMQELFYSHAAGQEGTDPEFMQILQGYIFGLRVGNCKALCQPAGCIFPGCAPIPDGAVLWGLQHPYRSGWEDS